jgi:hypothetical protein
MTQFLTSTFDPMALSAWQRPSATIWQPGVLPGVTFDLAGPVTRQRYAAKLPAYVAPAGATAPPSSGSAPTARQSVRPGIGRNPCAWSTRWIPLSTGQHRRVCPGRPSPQGPNAGLLTPQSAASLISTIYSAQRWPYRGGHAVPDAECRCRALNAQGAMTKQRPRTRATVLPTKSPLPRTSLILLQAVHCQGTCGFANDGPARTASTNYIYHSLGFPNTARELGLLRVRLPFSNVAEASAGPGPRRAVHKQFAEFARRR